MKLLALALLAAVLSIGAAPPSEQGLPHWLAGDWCTDERAQGQTCERWGPVAGGMMLGTSQTVRDGRTLSFEYMRIEMDGPTPVYRAQPGGRAPVSFRAVADGEGIAFVNASHDYPQRIRYRRKGTTLTAEIAMADGSRPMRWTYRLAQ